MPVSASSSSSSSSRSSSISSANRASTSTVSKPNAQKTSTASPTGYSTRDVFSLPECKVTPVKGGTTSSGTGVSNDECTFRPRDSYEA